jgi:hypothetical protein
MEDRIVLTEEQLTKFAVAAAKIAVEDFSKTHKCFFDAEKDRPYLHSFARSCRIHGASDDDIFVMVYSAKAGKTLFKKAGVGCLIIIGTVLLLILSGEAIRNPRILLQFFQ